MRGVTAPLIAFPHLVFQSVVDANREVLISLRTLAGEEADLDEAIRSCVSWHGIQEDRPPTIFEIITYVMAHHAREETIERDVNPSGILERIAGDRYGIFGKVAPGDEDVWPFTALRSPLETVRGPQMRFYTAVALRLWKSLRILPKHWSLAVHALRATATMLGASLAFLLLGQQWGALVTAVMLGVLVGAIPFINNTMSMPAAVAHFNTQLVLAVGSFEETMERVRSRTPRA